MTRADEELDEFGKRALAPLGATPPLDPQAASEIKVKFLLEAERVRQTSVIQTGEGEGRQSDRKFRLFGVLLPKTVMKALAAIILAFVVILAGSTFTVFASQSSLPGQALYPVKSWSEDFRLAVTASPEAKLNLTLEFTNRRMEEISRLLASGNAVNSQTADRFQRELEDALQLTAQMDDAQIQHALGEIKSHAENQGITMDELISKLPPQADPAMIRIQERLNEQVQLSNVGEMDPMEFRVQVRERLQKEQGPKHSNNNKESQSTQDEIAVTPMPSQKGNNNGNGLGEPTKVPGHNGAGNGMDETPPGNGNHGPNPTHTPKP